MRRWTLRTQLTLLYAVPFFLSGLVLLSVPILQTRETSPANSPVIPDVTGPDPAGGGVARILSISAVALFAMVLVSVVLGWLVAGRFLRPLRRITATARDISATNLHRRLGRTGHSDEFAELASTLDDLFARLDAAFVSQRHFVANASHELRTPLTAERTLLQVALADPDATVDSLRAACQEVLALGVAQERLVEGLLTLAGSEQGVEHRQPFDLAVVAHRVLLARPTGGIRIQSTLDSAPTAGDPWLVESLVANLVDNALRYNVPDGWVVITTRPVTDGARVTVENPGPNVAPDQVERLFQPFQQLGHERVRQRGSGHGLGLAIVRAIAVAHGATLNARSRPDGGLSIDVTFP